VYLEQILRVHLYRCIRPFLSYRHPALTRSFLLLQNGQYLPIYIAYIVYWESVKDLHKMCRLLYMMEWLKELRRCPSIKD
jgi:hypothetical protein